LICGERLAIIPPSLPVFFMVEQALNSMIDFSLVLFGALVTPLARRLRSHWRALLTLHAFAAPKAWRSSQNQTLAEVAGTSTDQCKSLPVVWITVHGYREVTTCP
jgi:hypothetical protein